MYAITIHCRILVMQSNERSSNSHIHFDGYIDLGKELSHLASVLVDTLEKVNQVLSISFIFLSIKMTFNFSGNFSHL